MTIARKSIDRRNPFCTMFAVRTLAVRTLAVRTLACALFSAVALSPVALSSIASAQILPTAPTAPVSWPSDSSGLTALATQLVNAWYAKVTAQDADGAKALMQSGFQWMNFQGALDRTGMLAAIKAGSTASASVSGVIATRVGDALVVSCQVSAQETIGGVTLPTDAAPRLSVWQWVDGAWRMSALGSMNIPSTRPAPNAPSFAGDATANAAGLAMVTAFVSEQTNKAYEKYDAMLAEGMQSVNFKGQKLRADLVKGAHYTKSSAPAVFTSARATTCGGLTVVTCTMSLGVSIGWSTLPADPAPFMAVFQGTGDAAKVIATVNTNQPK